MTTTQTDRIAEHGRKLLVIFPNAVEQDPVKLCKKLRRLEREAHCFALRLCNGPEFESEQAAENVKDRILSKVDALLRFSEAWVSVFLNQDPRGCALKIRDSQMRERKYDLPTDLGGYGILVPEIK